MAFAWGASPGSMQTAHTVYGSFYPLLSFIKSCFDSAVQTAAERITTHDARASQGPCRENQPSPWWSCALPGILALRFLGSLLAVYP